MSERKPVRCAVGIDFGGTRTKMGLVDERGNILSRQSFATREVSGPPAWMEAVGGQVEELRAKAVPAGGSIAGIGIGVPGFVDHKRGFIHALTNVPGWTGVELAGMARDRFGCPAFVDNDVNAMALGECTFGAGRLYEHAVFLTLGTGVGGGLLINNQLYRGAHSMAGEIGHISIDMNGIVSPQGKGGLEQYVGNERIVARTVKALEGGRSSRIRDLVSGDCSKVTPKVIAQAAQEGDALGLEIFQFMADCLATVCASVTYLLQPQAFIIGGGVAQSGDILFEPLRRQLKERLSPFFADLIEVRPAELGNDAGTIGAATLPLLSGK